MCILQKVSEPVIKLQMYSEARCHIIVILIFFDFLR